MPEKRENTKHTQRNKLGPTPKFSELREAEYREVGRYREVGASGIIHAWSFREKLRQMKGKQRRRRSLRGSNRIAVDTFDLSHVVDVEDFAKDEMELQKLAQMRVLVAAEVGGEKLNSLASAFPSSYSNLRLLRFLRKSKSRNVASAAARFIECIKWREEWAVDALIDDCRLPPRKYQEIRRMFAVEIKEVEGVEDTLRRTTVVLSADKWDSQGLMRALAEAQLELDDFLLFWIMRYEQIHKMLYERSLETHGLEYADLRCELKDLRLSSFSRQFVNEVVPKWLQITQDFYPETSNKIYFVDPPKIITAVWKVVGRFVKRGTKEKVVMMKTS
ncbi:hypothetical protein TrVE_jg1106 [Triparma verrucosa]|nr:hypothetical protein TrVE_jg1106 [Triparma verrucosa]